MKNRFFREYMGKVPESAEHELMIYGPIGVTQDDPMCQQTISAIKSLPKGDITVHINSQGGNIFGGIAIMNALKQHNGRKTIIVDGLAASAASVIAVGAADELLMAPGSFLMIHKAWTFCMGNADEFRHETEILDAQDKNILAIYAAKTGLGTEELEEIVSAETWLDADEAVRLKFADRRTDRELDEDVVAALDLTHFNNVPSALRARVRQGRPQSVREFESALRTLGFSQKEATAVASKGFNALQEQPAAPQRESEPAADAETVSNVALEKLLTAINDGNNALKEILK